MDISGSEQRDPLADFELINNEIYSYDRELSKLPMIVVANKMDMPESEANLTRFKAKYGDKYAVIPMTTIIHEGVNEFIATVADTLVNLPQAEPLRFEPHQLQKEENDDFEIVKLSNGAYEVIGGLVEQLSRKVDLDDFDSFRYFERVMKERGVIAALKKAGMQDGDTVIIGDVEFENVD